MARVIEKTNAVEEIPSPQAGGLLTPEEVAERLRVSRPTVYAWLKMGRLRGLRAGKVWRIQPADLDAFLRPAAADLETGHQYSPEESLPFLKEDRLDEKTRRAAVHPLKSAAGVAPVEATDGVQKAIRLIERWNAAEQGSDNESWEDLKAALNANRTSGRKLFPE
jgi:excisionase family DNA binding protein